MRKFLVVQCLLCLLSLPLLAQERRITGKVTSSEDGSTLPGVTVVLKGTSKGVNTDANGIYNISANDGTLVFSFVGSLTQEVAIGNKSVINVTLVPDTRTLNEVVVTAFGIQTSERQIGTSVAKINNAQITQAAPVNVANGLTGKVSGLQINTTNNGVGAGVRITLRGNRSFLGNNQALVVVDGVISDASFLSTINPDDIDNTTILKGPSAAALYGSDASNGAVVITTKKGSVNNVPQISYSNNTQFESISYMPGLQTQFGGNGGEAAPFYDRNFARLYVPFENQSFGTPYDGSIRPLGYGVEVRNADGTVRLDTLKVPYSSPSKDPRREFFNTGVTSQHNLSYRIGDAKNYFGLGVQRVDQSGVVPNDKYQRTTLSLTAGRTADKFAANGSVQSAFVKTDTENGDFNQLRPVYWNVLNQQAHAPINSYPLNDITSPYGDVNGYYNAYYPNPYWQITGDNSRSVSNRYTVQGSADVSYQFKPWLKVLYRVGGQLSNTQSKGHRAEVLFSEYALSDPWGAGNIASSVGKANASVSDGGALFTRFTGDLLVTLNPTFGDFTTRLILGQQTRQEYSRTNFDFANALVVPGVYNISNRLGNANVFEYNTRSRLIGFFGDLTIGYKDFAFLNITGRNDQTSLLSAANRSFFYPGVNASIILSDAIPGLKNNNILTFAKIRGALAKVGQVNVVPYQLQNVFTPGTGFPFGGQAGYALGNQQNDPNLKPEFTTNREVGLELGLFNRVNLEAVYYSTTTTNQTVPIGVSRATGYTTALINTGTMQNQGVELDLSTTRPIVNLGGFTWNINTNFTYLESKATDLYQDLERLNIPYGGSQFRPDLAPGASDVFAARNLAYPALFVNDIQRIQNTNPKAPNYDATGQFVGRPVVSATTGYPILDPNLKYAGTTQPKYRFGLTNTFKYKGLALSTVIEYRGGAVIYNSLGNALEFTGAGIRSTYAGRQNFVFPGSVTVTSNADGTTNAITPNTNVTTRDGNLTFWTNSAYHNAGYSYVTSANFWKLREVALSYTIPASILGYTKFIKSMSVALTGRNLIMLRPKTNVFTDPEFSGGTNANDTSNAVGTTTEYQTPPTRFYGFRVSVGF